MKKQPPSGVQIIEKYLENVEENYSHYPLVHHTYLKETESLKNGTKLYSNIAEIEYLRYGYHNYEDDLMKLIRGKNEIHIDTLFEDHLYGGLAEIKKDLVKYPREFLEVKKGYYQYEVKAISDSDELVYEVAFNPINDKSKYQGHLYIRPSDFALIKAEYKFSKYGIDLLNKIQHSVDFEWKEITEIIIYEKPEKAKHYLDDDDLYYLKRIKTEGVGYHYEWKENLSLSTDLLVYETNRTRFFANEYYRIDDNAALSQMDYEKENRDVPPVTDKHINHRQMVAQELLLGEDIDLAREFNENQE